MEDIHERVLFSLYKFFEKSKPVRQPTDCEKINESFPIGVDRIRCILKCLRKEGYIKLIDRLPNERIIVSGLTSEGRVFVEDRLL